MVSRDRVTFVYDDVASVPSEIMAATGVRVFGDLLSAGVRLRDALTGMLERAGCGDAVHLLSLRDVAEMRVRLGTTVSDQRFLLLRSNTTPTAPWDLVQVFLEKLVHLRQPIVIVNDSAQPTGAALLDAELLKGYLDAVLADDRDDFIAALSASHETVPDALGLVDLRDQVNFTEFLSSGFAVRHFNRIDLDRFVITKRSADKNKMRREASYHGLLPEEVRHFFVQPYGYQEDAEGASYRMRRLYIPDMAVQWVHRAFSPADFERFLDHVLNFLRARPVREVGAERAGAVARQLYVTKVRERIDALALTTVGRSVDATLVAGGRTGGIAGLHEQYLELYEQLTPRRHPTRLALTHGDLCFSNILYSQPSQLLQLVDPRGADTEPELFSDAYYDVAKLSHSVLGGYDLVHAGLCRITHGADLELELELQEHELVEMQTAFLRRIEELDFDPRLMRLYEASLFLSMMGLHIDAPRKVLAFALRAGQIMAALSPPRRRRSMRA